MGLSVRHVQRMAKSGELPYQTHMNERNRPEYLFPLSSLPDAAQQKYFAEHAPAALPAATPAKAKKADKPAACKPLEAYTAEERGEIGYWITTVDRWQTYRNKAGTKKAECDEKFVLLCRMEEPDRQISVETLYRKWAAIREGDYGALVDMRGKARKGMSKMPEAIERVFLTLYLDDRQYPIPRCIDMTKQWAQEEMPEALPLPCYHTFYRKAKALPEPVVVLCRQGPKAYYDQCSPYIRRNYENFFSNEVWVGDTHTLDVISISPEGIKHRLHLSAWQDARSGVFVGWYVSDNPGSQETLMWQTPVYDRTAADVAAGAEKCYITAELLNRIEGNTAHMAQLLGVEIDTRTWTSLGLLTRAQMQRILDNLATVRAAYYTLPGTPNIPTAPSTLYSAINDMEQVLWSLHELWQRNSVKQYAGEICAGQEIGVI